MRSGSDPVFQSLPVNPITCGLDTRLRPRVNSEGSGHAIGDSRTKWETTGGAENKNFNLLFSNSPGSHPRTFKIRPITEEAVLSKNARKRDSQLFS
jgi:hypothetical protein